MEGGSSPETLGMIPRAVEQVFRVVEDLKSKGWEYSLEGQFLEIVSAVRLLLLCKSSLKESSTVQRNHQ
jgi:hypothetical protein